MALPQYTGTALTAAGTALSIFGQIQANLAQARAEEQNAAWLRDQAEFFEEVTERELGLARREGMFQVGEQIGSFVSGGVELEGSALDVINSSFNRLSDELAAIQAQGDFAVNEALFKAEAAQFRAGELSSFENNFFQALGVGAQGGGQTLRSFRQESR